MSRDDDEWDPSKWREVIQKGGYYEDEFPYLRFLDFNFEWLGDCYGGFRCRRGHVDET